MNSGAVGHDYHAALNKHASQKDYATGFGGKYGVQDRQDKVGGPCTTIQPQSNESILNVFWTAPEKWLAVGVGFDPSGYFLGG